MPCRERWCKKHLPGSQRHRMGGDSLARPGEAKALLGGSLDTHPARINSHGGGQPLPHQGNVGGQLGPLGQYRGVHIANPIPVFIQ